MAETRPTPLDLFQAGEAELVTNAEVYRAAYEHQGNLKKDLSEAERATDAARRTANEYGGDLLGRIHDSVTDETDPGDYLRAILNTYHSGNRIGDEVADRLQPMREQMRERPTPIGIVGTTSGDIRLGFSAGDILVRRREEHETGFDTVAGIRLAIPLARMNSYSHSSWGFSHDNDWSYSGNEAEPRSIGVKQSLSQLRVAGTSEQIRTYNNTPHAPFNQYDTVMHHERDIKDHTGFVPMIAYGEAAVIGLLAALYDRRNVASYAKPPSPDTVLAAGISLDLSPSDIADVDEDALKERLHGQFLTLITRGVADVIRNESFRRKLPNSGGWYDKWPIAASPQVMRYASVSVEEVTVAMQRGIEQVTDDLRVDDPADRPSWILTDEPEHRLLEGEAQDRAVGLVAVRYGLGIEPSSLQSDGITSKLAAQLEKKREEQERHEKRVRENPWLYASTR